MVVPTYDRASQPCRQGRDAKDPNLLRNQRVPVSDSLGSSYIRVTHYGLLDGDWRTNASSLEIEEERSQR